MKKLHVNSHKKKSVRRTSKMFSSLLSLRRPMQVNHVTMVTYSSTLTTYVNIKKKLVLQAPMFPCESMTQFFIVLLALMIKIYQR